MSHLNCPTGWKQKIYGMQFINRKNYGKKIETCWHVSLNKTKLISEHQSTLTRVDQKVFPELNKFCFFS